MKKLLCLLMFGFATMNFGMEDFHEEVVGEVAIVLGGMVIDGATDLLRDVVNIAGQVNNDIQESIFGTTAEEGERIEQAMSDDFMGDHCAIS